MGVFSAVNQRGPEAVRYTPPQKKKKSDVEVFRADSGLSLEKNSSYFHSGSDAVYFENIPILTAGHRSRFKVLLFCALAPFILKPQRQNIPLKQLLMQSLIFWCVVVNS